MKIRKYIGNWPTSVRKAAKYSVRLDPITKKLGIGVVIETTDDELWKPVTTKHADLVKMVMKVKKSVDGSDSGGAFYINEFRQVIVPAGSPVEYFYAGTYENDLIFELEKGVEISGRPHDRNGNLLSPGDAWIGPHPGIPYVLEAGAKDIRYDMKLSPIRSKRVKLSKLIGADSAKSIARRIAKVKDFAGGTFYVNEYRSIFAPVNEDNGLQYRFVGTLSDKDPWFPRGTWEGAEEDQAEANELSQPKGEEAFQNLIGVKFLMNTTEKSVEIRENETGFSYDSLFGPYLQGASEIFIQDTFIRKSHQVANFQRFCELAVRIGDCNTIKLRSKEEFGEDLDEVNGKLENLRRSLANHGVKLEVSRDNQVHDREIVLNSGWKIVLGRGLDIYKRPDSWNEIGASDFSLRPCWETNIQFIKLKSKAQQAG